MSSKKENPIKVGLYGVAMAAADSVPGVSGGTIAFILGYYDKFIGAIHDLFYSKGWCDERKNALFFLIKFGIGWVAGFLAAVVLLTSLLETHIYSISSLFVGFVLAAIPVIIMEEKSSIKGKYADILFALLGLGVVFLISYLNMGQGRSCDLTHLSLGSALYILVAGAIAITAMFLPGMSGSTLMLIFGIYLPLITGIKACLTGDFAALPGIIIFAVGILAGVLGSVKVIQTALHKYRSKMIYFIVGMLVGSLYAIFMGPTTLDTPQAAMSFSTFKILPFIIGCAIIIGMQVAKKKLSK